MSRQPGAGFRGSIAGVALALWTGVGWAGAPSAEDFDAYLVQGYGALAEAAARSTGESARASYFRERKELAVRRLPIAPAAVDGRSLDPFTVREASFAREELVERLDLGARQKQPLLAAIAQVNFDCWVAPEPARSGHSSGDSECRNRFYGAFVGLGKNAPSAADTATFATAPVRPPAAQTSAPAAVQAAADGPAPASAAAPGTSAAAEVDPGAMQRAYEASLQGAQPPLPAATPGGAAPNIVDPGEVQRAYVASLRAALSSLPAGMPGLSASASVDGNEVQPVHRAPLLRTNSSTPARPASPPPAAAEPRQAQSAYASALPEPSAARPSCPGVILAGHCLPIPVVRPLADWVTGLLRMGGDDSGTGAAGSSPTATSTVPVAETPGISSIPAQTGSSGTAVGTAASSGGPTTGKASGMPADQ